MELPVGLQVTKCAAPYQAYDARQPRNPFPSKMDKIRCTLTQRSKMPRQVDATQDVAKSQDMQIG